jgi:small subunit ribosomal protein S17
MTEKKLSVRGKLIEGKITKMKAKKTAQVEIKVIKYIPKYERYLVNKKRYSVHVPDDVKVEVDDNVLCGETRKISKTKSFVIIKKIESLKKGDLE